jgi:hypothetical protein
MIFLATMRARGSKCAWTLRGMRIVRTRSWLQASRPGGNQDLFRDDGLPRRYCSSAKILPKPNTEHCASLAQQPLMLPTVLHQSALDRTRTAFSVVTESMVATVREGNTREACYGITRTGGLRQNSWWQLSEKGTPERRNSWWQLSEKEHPRCKLLNHAHCTLIPGFNPTTS